MHTRAGALGRLPLRCAVFITGDSQVGALQEARYISPSEQHRSCFPVQPPAVFLVPPARAVRLGLLGSAGKHAVLRAPKSSGYCQSGKNEETHDAPLFHAFTLVALELPFLSFSDPRVFIRSALSSSIGVLAQWGFLSLFFPSFSQDDEQSKYVLGRCFGQLWDCQQARRDTGCPGRHEKGHQSIRVRSRTCRPSKNNR